MEKGNPMKFLPAEFERYSRQMIIEGFGIEGQSRLRRARVLVAGVGGLGCPAALYLAAAGVGKLLLVDRDNVEKTNLNRQILYWEEDLGRSKVEAAGEKIRQFNSQVEVETLKMELTFENVYPLVEEVDLVVDGLDNFEARFAVNRACVEAGKPFIHAAVHGLQGELLTVIPGKTPCYQCYVAIAPPERRPLPVLGATSGMLACLEVMEAVKILTGVGEPLLGKLLIFDGYQMEFRLVELKKLETCEVCRGK